MKTAIVTGTTGKIGLEIARVLKKEGYGLALVYRSEEKLNILEEFKDDKNVIFLKGDLKNREDCEDVCSRAIEHFGRVDVLVNNAAKTKDNLLIRMQEEDFIDVIETNLYSVFYMSKILVKHMLKQKSGKIINISSVSGIMGNPGQCNYAASKAAVIAFSKSLSKEVARKNINVNVICPGFVDTDMTKNLKRDEIIKSIPAGRMAEPADIAEAVKFLVSDGANYIHGKELVIDGGLI